MNRFFLCLALVSGGLLAGCATLLSQPDDEQYWSAQISSVRIGMTRGEVEKILPVWHERNPQGLISGPGEASTITGGGQSVAYWVSPDWRVFIIYDVTGGEGSSSNRVISPGQFEKVTYESGSLDDEAAYPDNARTADLSLDILAKMYHLDVANPHEEDRIRLAHDFPKFTRANQLQVLSGLWPEARCPEFADVLSPLAIFPTNSEDENDLRFTDYVFVRLLDVKPEAVRPLILEDIQRGNPLFSLFVLEALPDKQLPELDDVLAAHLNNPRDDTFKIAVLIERYASGRILPQVVAFYGSAEKGWACSIQTAILRYWLKYDRPAGLKAVENAANMRNGTGCYTSILGETLRGFLDADADQLVLKFVHDPDPDMAADAQSLAAEYNSCFAPSSNTNWPVLYDRKDFHQDQQPVRLFVPREPQTLDYYTTQIPAWDELFRQEKATINWAQTHELGRVNGQRVIEAKLSLSGSGYDYADVLMILEETEPGRFLPVFAAKYEYWDFVPAANVIANNKSGMVVSAGLDYLESSNFKTLYRITISPGHDPVVAEADD